MMKRFGASGGVARRQADIRSPRTTVSTSSAIRPSDSDTICTTVAPGRRCSDVMAKRHAWWRNAPRRRRKDSSASQPTSANRPNAPTKPPAVSSASCRSPACHSSSPRKTAAPKPYVTSASGFGAACSRRITRLCGTLRSWSTGGSAKPTSSSMPVAMPCSAGSSDTGGSSVGIKPLTISSSTKWAPKPTSTPSTLPASPTMTNSMRNSAPTSFCVMPRQRSIAQASRWRCMKRRAAMATATAASIAERSPTSDRKRSARSIVERISGRPFSSVSMRTPRTLSAAIRPRSQRS